MPASPVAPLLAGCVLGLVVSVGSPDLAAASLLPLPSPGKAGSAPPAAPLLAGPAAAPAAAPSPSVAPAAAPARAPLETLAESIQRRLAFPFQPDCQGNTQEIVACLWQRRDRQDQRLAGLLGGAEALEAWRGARAAACRRSAERGSGGSIQPILGLGCENALNATLIQQTAGPLLR